MAKQDHPRWALSRRTIPFASVLILVCLLAASWITFDRVRTLLQTEKLVSHSNEVRASLIRTFALVAQAESDQRGYVLTLDPASKKRYYEAKPKIEDETANLRRLVTDNSEQIQTLNDLEAEISSRLIYLDSSMKERDAHGLQRTVDLMKIGEGIAAMNQIRDEATTMSNEEKRLLRERIAAQESQTVQAETSFVLTLIISVALISAFGYLSSRLVAAREDAADEERAFRGNLEAEVQRTRAAEIRLERALTDLKRSNEELQNFAFVASHDLQEPLRKIRAFTDRVRRKTNTTLDDESKDSLERVEAAAERMQRLILDLLDLSRITTKVRPHVVNDFDLVIDEVADDLQARLDETGGSVVHANLPAVVMDPAQLRQLVQNLLANALKFRREGVAPVVKVSAERRNDGRVAVRVSDNGIGFEAKYADRIFVVFQRLHGRGEYEGSGIGLAIVKKIVERHGGTIVAKGELNQGATFVFDLPGEAPSLGAEYGETPLIQAALSNSPKN